MESHGISTGLSDTLTILGAAGIVIPAFARLKVSPVIGFILVGMIAGPFALGAMAGERPWLQAFSISDPKGIAPFAEFGIILLLFAIGLELSAKRLWSMRRAVFGLGSAELLVSALLIATGLAVIGEAWSAAIALGLALAMSSTALVLPIAGTEGPVGRAAFSMLLFEDLALVPLLFVLGSGGALEGLAGLAVKGIAVVAAMLVVGRYALPPLFAQAARTKSPELFLAISLVTVMLASLATGQIGLSPLLGALIAGLLIAETDYRGEVESITAPLRGLALGVFLITVGMRIDLSALVRDWPQLLAALGFVITTKVLVTGLLLRIGGWRRGASAETSLLMGSPSETTLILLGAAASAGTIDAASASFWQAVTALGLTVTPLLATLGRRVSRRVDRKAPVAIESADGRTVIFGFGRVGRMVADMLSVHDRPYLAIESDIDAVRAAGDEGYDVVFGDVSRGELVDRLKLGSAAALVLTMDNPVLSVRLAKRVRGWCPELPIIARARDTAHAAELYRAGVSDAVPETLEASLQLSEAVLIDIGLAMGPVIASIHEKRSELRAEIMAGGAVDDVRVLGRRRGRDSLPAKSA